MSAPRRVLLIAPHGSYRTGPFLRAAAELGLEVLVASRGEHSIVSSYAQGLHIDPADSEAALARILEAARKQPFGAVLGTDDSVVELASRAAAALGLPHNPAAAVRLARRKDLARARLAERGVRVPAFARIRLDADEEALERAAGRVGFPLVMKPLSLSASRGVMRADDTEALHAGLARLRTLLACEPRLAAEERGEALLERFVPGTEVAVEAMLEGGRLQLLAVFDKPDPLDGPFFEETLYVTPSRLDAARLAAIETEVAAACAAFGLREGPVHAECRLNDEGVWIIELAARTIGGLCARLLRFGTGLTLEQLVLRHASGRTVVMPAAAGEAGAAGVMMIPIPRAGIFKRVEGILAAQRVPGIEDIDIQIREGHELVPLPEGASYLGFIFARGATPAVVEAALREAHARLRIVITPLWKPLAAAG